MIVVLGFSFPVWLKILFKFISTVWLRCPHLTHIARCIHNSRINMQTTIIISNPTLGNGSDCQCVYLCVSMYLMDNYCARDGILPERQLISDQNTCGASSFKITLLVALSFRTYHHRRPYFWRLIKKFCSRNQKAHSSRELM